MQPLPVVVLISGRGSNLQALIDATESGYANTSIEAVISNRPGARGLQRAQTAGIPTEVVDHHSYPDRESFDRELIRRIEVYQARLVVLAGFMRIFSPVFVQHFKDRLINIHPSLLPRFRGLDTHQRALAEGVEQHGASVHLVTDKLDGGQVIVQAQVPVLPDDDAERLAARVLEQEHRIYPLVLRWFGEGRLKARDGQLMLDGKILTEPVLVGADV